MYLKTEIKVLGRYNNAYVLVHARFLYIPAADQSHEGRKKRKYGQRETQDVVNDDDVNLARRCYVHYIDAVHSVVPRVQSTPHSRITCISVCNRTYESMRVLYVHVDVSIVCTRLVY